MNARLLVLGIVLLACACGESDVDQHPWIASFEVSPISVVAGSTVELDVVVDNFPLVDPATHHNPQVRQGHYHVNLDGISDPPLLMDYRSPVTLLIPADTPAGSHTLSLVLVRDDHLAQGGVTGLENAEVTIVVAPSQ